MSTSPVDDRLLQAKVQNQTGNVPTADIEEEDDEGVPERTPEFELSRQLDETMRAVYKHLHDAFKDQTYKGQTLKFGRAYTAITQFHTDHSDELTQLQTASIACTRDQVAKLTAEKEEADAARKDAEQRHSFRKDLKKEIIGIFGGAARGTNADSESEEETKATFPFVAAGRRRLARHASTDTEASADRGMLGSFFKRMAGKQKSKGSSGSKEKKEVKATMKMKEMVMEMEEEEEEEEEELEK